MHEYEPDPPIVTYGSFGWAVEGTNDSSCVLMGHMFAYRELSESHRAIGIRLLVTYDRNSH